MQLFTVLQKGSRKVTIEWPTWDTDCVPGRTGEGYYYNYAAPSGIPDNTNKTVSGTFDVGFHAGVAVVSDRVLNNADLFDLASDAQYRIVGLDMGATKYVMDGNFCFGFQGFEVWKNIIAHEWGHAISDNSSGVIVRRVDGVSENDALHPDCRCDGFGHCLTSWERIDGAQSEGFANFGAAAILNGRNDSTEPVFVSHIPYNLPTIPTITAAVRNAALITPWALSMNTQYRYMENACYYNMVDHGTEWDWHSFFWQVWEKGTNKLEVSEIVDLWPPSWAGVDYRQWADIDGRAFSQLTTAKLTNFRAKAELNGIDH